MTDDLERLLNATEGQAPSAEFVARLRARIVAETEGVDARMSDAIDAVDDDGEGDHGGPVPDIGSRPEPRQGDELGARRASRRRRLGLLTAVAAAAVAMVVGVWGLTAGRDDPAAEIEILDTPTEAPGPSTDRTGVPITTGNTFVDPGTYRIDTLGTAFTFVVDETTKLETNENGVVSLSDFTGSDRTITFRRTSLLPSPSDPTAAIEPSVGWPAEDLAGWLDALGERAVFGEPMATTLGGREAIFVELEFPCPAVECAAGARFAALDGPMFMLGSRNRLWVVDQGEEDAIVVVVVFDDEDRTEWLDTADAILASIELEAVQPNPVRRLPSGPVELDVLDGITVQLPNEAVVAEPFAGFARILPAGIGGDVELLTRPLDTAGDVVTAERLLQLLADEAVRVVELEPTDLGGIAARVFSVDSGPEPDVVLATRQADLLRVEDGWEPPRLGYLWLLEHPERGLLVVSAEALSGPGEAQPLRDWADDLVCTLEFDDS